MIRKPEPLEGGLEVRQPGQPAGGGDDPDVEPIRSAIRGIRYGEVRVVIQDGVVIQIDRLEKRRLK